MQAYLFSLLYVGHEEPSGLAVVLADSLERAYAHLADQDSLRRPAYSSREEAEAGVKLNYMAWYFNGVRALEPGLLASHYNS